MAQDRHGSVAAVSAKFAAGDPRSYETERGANQRVWDKSSLLRVRKEKVPFDSDSRNEARRNRFACSWPRRRVDRKRTRGIFFRRMDCGILRPEYPSRGNRGDCGVVGGASRQNIVGLTSLISSDTRAKVLFSTFSDCLIRLPFA